MNLPLKIAIRYAFTFRSFHFITIISFISLIGIIVGVAALICVMSIFNGFREFSENQLIGFDPHIRISANQGSWIENKDSIGNLLKSTDGIRFAAPLIQGKVVAMRQSTMQAAVLNAIQSGEFEKVSGVAQRMIQGKFNLNDQEGISGIVLGAMLADRLSAIPGDTLVLLSPELLESAIKTYSFTGGVKVVVTGLFQSNNPDYDEQYIYSSESVGRRLFKQPLTTASSIDIRLNNINDLQKVQKELKSHFAINYKIESWEELHSELFSVMNLERLATFVILSLIIMISVFNVLASLAMTVIEKRPDIGILKAIGGNNSFIQKIFIWEGSLIGLIGAVSGTLLGLGLCYGQLTFEWFKLDTSKYLISAIPITVRFIDVVVTAILAIGLSFFATIYPARRAQSIQIIEAVRTE